MAGKRVPEDEYLKCVGQVANMATLADDYLCWAFELVSGCAPDVAIAIYHTLDAVPVKERLVTRVADAVCDDEEKRLIEALIGGVKKANNQRIDLVHSAIGIDSLGIVRYKPRDQSRKPITKAYLDGLLNEAGAGLIIAQGAYEALMEKRGLQPPEPP
jgi:hypothetical protein